MSDEPPCPFCGAQPEVVFDELAHPDNGCFLRQIRTTRAAWNKRFFPTAPAAVDDEARAIVERDAALKGRDQATDLANRRHGLLIAAEARLTQAEEALEALRVFAVNAMGTAEPGVLQIVNTIDRTLAALTQPQPAGEGE